MNPARKGPDVSTYRGRCAERLKTLREKANMTVEDMATALEVDKFKIYKWEAGTGLPKIDDLPTLAGLFGLKSPRSVLAEE